MMAVITKEKEKRQPQQELHDPMTKFMYFLKSKESKRQ